MSIGHRSSMRVDRYKAVERQDEAGLVVGTEVGKEIVRRDHEMVLRYLDDHGQILGEEMVRVQCCILTDRDTKSGWLEQVPREGQALSMCSCRYCSVSLQSR